MPENIDVMLASIAIVISVLTALFSYIEGRKLAKQQRSFEVGLYCLKVLDPAKKKITELDNDMNRYLNATELLDEGHLELMKTIPKLDAQVVDTYESIKHHLNPEDQKKIEKMRTAFIKPLYVAVKDKDEPTAIRLTLENMPSYTKMVLQAIEHRMNNALDFNTSD